MKKTIAKLLTFMMIFTMVFPVNAFGVISKNDYTGHWAEDTIQSWLDKSYVTGYPDGSFIPEGYVTRVEFVKMVNKAFNYTEISDISFTDVESDAWYYQDVQKAYKAEYIAGVSETQFAPNDKLTREQAAVIISRILKLEGYTSGIDKFEDKNDISSYAIEGVGAAAKAEFIKGYDTDNTFKPKNPIKRAEAVSILDRAMTVDDQTNDLTIEDAGTVIENQTFNNVHITEKVGNGEVTLKNVTITGELLVEGGGLNSIILENSTINELTTNKDDGKVRILITGNTAVDATNILSGATLEQQNLTGTGFIQVNVEENVEENQSLIVSAYIGNLTVKAKVKVNLKTGTIEKMTLEKASEGISVNLADDANVLLVIINARASFAGKGEISKAIIKANKVVFERKPKEVEVADGFSIPKIIPITSGKSLNSGNNHTVDIPVTSVSINNAELIFLEVGKTVNLEVIIEPYNATNKNVKWTSSNTTVAAISSEGILLSKTTGSAIITATTVDGNKTANCDVIVKDSITWEYVINEDNTLTITKYLGVQEILNIPDIIDGKTVKGLHLFAFGNNRSIKSINISSGIENIISSPSGRILENYTVSLDNKYYKSVDGILYNYDGTVLISYPERRVQSSFIVPNTVEIISECAFYGNSYIKNIIMQNNLIKIEQQAFSNCNNLIEVAIPPSVEIIGHYIMDYSEKAIIKCYKNSEAEYYAIYHGINYDNSMGIVDKRREIYFDISCSGYPDNSQCRVYIKDALGNYDIYHDGISFTIHRKKPGDTVEILVKPIEGYKLVKNSLCYWKSDANWYVNETRYPVEGTKVIIDAINEELGMYEFVMPDYDIGIEANFELISH